MPILKTSEKLGEILVKSQLVSAEQLGRALEVQRGTNRRIGEVLVELGLITELDIAQALSRQRGGGGERRSLPRTPPPASIWCCRSRATWTR